MASEPISVDPRIVSLLVGPPGEPLPMSLRDTLDRIAGTISLFADLLGGYSGDSQFVEGSDRQYALCLQLESIASVVKALSDSLKKSTAGPTDLVVKFSSDELGKLELIALCDSCSVSEVIVNIVTSKLKSFIPGQKS